MKKIINNPQDVVLEMCKGMAIAHPSLRLDEKYKVFQRKTLNSDKVTLISGGGSGHEPAHAGFIGSGMLDSAVCGDVFASPSQIQMYHAIKETASNKGTLLIIKNYSGDMMNFKNAAFLAKEDGIEVDYVKVDDDIAVNDSLYTVGKRGVAGTVLVHKVAGAAAQRGYDLPKVKQIAQKAIDNVKSIGFAFRSCTVPAKGTKTFEIAEDEMEYGVGIHGEPGIRREKVISADELAKRMVQALAEELHLKANDEAVVLVNGFGGTPLQELYVLNYAVFKELEKRQIKVVKVLTGNFMTSIDMEGASISIMKVDAQLKELFFETCDTPALKMQQEEMTCYKEEKVSEKAQQKKFDEIKIEPKDAKIEDDIITRKNIIYIVDCMSDCIIRNEVPFCELDSFAGDGDFGMSVAKGFRKLKEEWNEILSKDAKDIGSFLQACSMVIMEHCGGASGPVWGSAFRAAGKSTEGKMTLSRDEFAQMLQAAVKGIQSTGERTFGRGAVVGDKTLMDALIPTADVWSNACNDSNLSIQEIFIKAATAAQDGAKMTETIVARMGRAGTVGERSLGHPNAGAYALGVIFCEIAQKVSI